MNVLCAYCGGEMSESDSFILEVSRSETFTTEAPAILTGRCAGRAKVSGPTFSGRKVILAWHPHPDCAYDDGLTRLFGLDDQNLDVLVKRAAKRGHRRVEVL